MSKFLPSWFVKRPEYSAPFLLFILLWFQGSFLGLSDDEAYYWVLAQKPALGYAFHPPAVAWMIRFFQILLSPVFGQSSEALVRLPAAFGSGLILFLALSWLRFLELDSKKVWLAVPLVLSFFSFFSLSWMIVPDIPLFLGLTLVFWATWKVIFQKSGFLDFALLFFGCALAVLGKYSGILVAGSSAVALLVWAKPSQRWPGLLALALGLCGAALPILVWNSQHEWASILYQIRDRHGHDLSWFRYLKFWLTQLGLVGPIVIGVFFYLIRKWSAQSSQEKTKPVISYVLLWALPPACIYFIQPLFADFKPHWAFVVWWPTLLALTYLVLKGRLPWIWGQIQMVYGLSFGLLLLIACQIPIFTWLGVNPRNDVTNDLYGWSEAAKQLRNSQYAEVPARVVGSRYQTSAQAAFYLGSSEQTVREVTFVPRSRKELDEWPSLEGVDSQGPDWPRLKSPVLYVSDNRYEAPPEFKGARCERFLHVQKTRWSRSVGWIDLWHCSPT